MVVMREDGARIFLSVIVRVILMHIQVLCFQFFSEDKLQF